MSLPDRTLNSRDQAASAFSATLMRLCDATGALAAALVDSEGETVDYAGRVDPYEIRVVAAECRLLLQQLLGCRFAAWAPTDEVWVRAQRASLAVVALSSGYALVVTLPRHCFRISVRALAEAVREICDESGLTAPDRFERAERWMRVEVRTDTGDPHRPLFLWRAGSWEALALLGRFQPHERECKARELGFRARLASGQEFNLVREPLGHWYVDEPGLK